MGGLALQASSFTERVPVGVDGELIGELNSLVTFLQEHDVPADLGENMSGWMDKEFWNQLAKERIQAWQLQMFHHEEEKECVIARPAPMFSYFQTSCKNPNGQAHTSQALISIH